MRMTVQRKVILDQLRTHTDHPGADAVYGEVRDVLPNISLGTVYRNLDILTRNGVIQRLDLGNDYAHFDPNPESHPHFVCRRCGVVLDLHLKGGLAAVEKTVVAAIDLEGLIVDRISVVVEGVCRDCRSI